MHLNLYFAWAAWITLCLIVLSRPLADLFGSIKLRKIVIKRKEIGIICGFLAIAHISLYAFKFGLPINFLFDAAYWNFSTFFGWGLLAFVCLIPLLITSNKASMIRLRKNWKRIQRLTYLFFIATAIHIFLVAGKWYFSLLPLGIWAFLFFAAEFKKFNKRIKN